DPRPPVAVGGGEPALPDVRRLHHVVVDAHDRGDRDLGLRRALGGGAHGTLPSPQTRSDAPSDSTPGAPARRRVVSNRVERPEKGPRPVSRRASRGWGSREGRTPP